jgi:hypothetical protein
LHPYLHCRATAKPYQQDAVMFQHLVRLLLV